MLESSSTPMIAPGSSALLGGAGAGFVGDPQPIATASMTDNIARARTINSPAGFRYRAR